MSEYIPLYTDGKRDSRKRFIGPSGDIISYRQAIKLREGITPERKALRRYYEGKSLPGKTVKKLLKRKERKPDGAEPRKRRKGAPPANEPREPTGGEWVREVHKQNTDRGYYQLRGMYTFYNPRLKQVAQSTGYSTAQSHKKRGMDLLILRQQAVRYAKANLDFSGWKLISIDEEYWLKW